MITTDSIKTAVTKIAQLMEESADELNAADGLLGDGDLGIMPTPGLPLLTADTTEVLMTTGNFGNFRRHTLLRYLDSLNNVPRLKEKHYYLFINFIYLLFYLFIY